MDREVSLRLNPEHTLLDAGCGRTAPMLVRYRGRAKRLVGIDLVEFPQSVSGAELYRRNLNETGLADSSIDIVMARSVMEHVEDPLAVYNEMYRVLRPGGRFVFLTANFWDYASLIAMAIPNRLHPWIVSRTEGREEADVFPTKYRTNTRRQVFALAHKSGFRVESFAYLGQYPGYFMFNGLLFLIATGYEKLISRFDALGCLRGWIFVVLQRPDTPSRREIESAIEISHTD